MEHLLDRWLQDERVRMKVVIRKSRISNFLISLLSAVLICGVVFITKWLGSLNLLESFIDTVEIGSGLFILCILLVIVRRDTVSKRMKYLKAILEQEFKHQDELECLIREMGRDPLFELEDPCSKEIFVLTPHYMMKTGKKYMITKADDIARIEYHKYRSTQSQHIRYAIECKDSEGKLIGNFRFSLPDTFEAACHAVSKFRGEEQVS